MLMLARLDGAAFFQVIPPVIADAAIKATAFLLIAFLLTAVLHRLSAAGRHLIWLLAAVGSLSLPVLSAALPSWHVLPNGWLLTGSTRSDTTNTAAVGEGPATELLSPSGEIGQANDWNRQPILLAPPAKKSSRPFQDEVPQNDLPILTSQQLRSDEAVDEKRLTIIDKPDRRWARVILIVWSLGAGAVIIWLSAGILRVRSLCRNSAEVIDPRRVDLFRSALEVIGLKRPVRLLVRQSVTTPMATGIARPAVLLPSASREWSVERLKLVFLHEMAHVKRQDCLTQALSTLACTVYWFHPLIWFALRRIRIDAEHASDDLVLATGAKASDYAEQLLAVSLKRSPMSGPLAAIGMARPSRLGRRVRSILDGNQSRRPISRRLFVASIVLLVAITVPVAIVRSHVERSSIDSPSAGAKPAEVAAVESVASKILDETDESGRLRPIRGDIRDVSGKPVAGARVLLRQQPSAITSGGDPTRSADLSETMSGVDGRFEFTGVVPPPEHLRRSPFPLDVVVTAPGTAIAWRHLPTVSAVNLKLTPPCSLPGSVVDVEGRPVAGASVRVLRLLPVRAIPGIVHGTSFSMGHAGALDLAHAATQLSATTDTDGRFEIDGLPDGTGVLLEASHPDFQKERVYAAATKSSDRSDDALPNVVQSGFAQFTLDQGYRLRVQVVDASTGEPVSGARFPRPPIVYPPSETADGAGRFELEQLAPRDFQLFVYPPEGTDYLGSYDRVELSGNEYVIDRTVGLSRGAVISGEVVDERTGQGLAGVKLSFRPTNLDEVIAQAEVSPAQPLWQFIEAVTDGTGQFRTGVPPSDWRILLLGEVPGYRTPHSTGGIEQIPERFERSVSVSGTEPVNGLRFQLEPAPRFRGTVYDPQGRPAAKAPFEAKVVANENTSSGPFGISYRSVFGRSDVHGRFLIDSLYTSPGGETELHPAQVLFRSADGRSAALVTVPPPMAGRSEVELNIRLERCGMLLGRIVDDDTGRPVEGASIVAMRKTGPDGRTLESERLLTTVQSGSAREGVAAVEIESAQ